MVIRDHIDPDLTYMDHVANCVFVFLFSFFGIWNKAGQCIVIIVIYLLVVVDMYR